MLNSYGSWKTNKQGQTVPNFSALKTDDRELEKHNLRQKNGSGVPLMPRAIWNEDSSPNFSQFDVPTTNEDYSVLLNVLKQKYSSVGTQIFNVMTSKQKEVALAKIKAGDTNRLF